MRAERSTHKAIHSFTCSGRHTPLQDLTPLTLGIPFGEDDLPSDSELVLLDEHGRRLPLQTRAFVHWRPDRSQVQWLLVDTLIPAGVARCHLLHAADWDPQVEAVPAPQLQVQQDTDQLSIDTGPLRLRLRTAFPHWQAPYRPACWLGLDIRGAEGWQPLLSDPIAAICTDQHGVRHDSVTAGAPPRVTLLEQGPVRATVRVCGVHSDAQGRRFTPYDWRIHCHAGSADIELEHRLLFDQDAQCVQLAQCGIDLPLDVGLDRQVGVGLDGSVIRTPARAPVRLDQLDADTCRLDGASWRSDSGRQLDGVAQLSGSRGAVALALPDAWRLYPLAVEARHDRLLVHAWPDSADTLSFQSRAFREPPIPDEWHCTDEESFRRAAAERPTAPVCYNRFPIDSVASFRQKQALVDAVAPGRARNRADLYCEDGRGAALSTRCRIRAGSERLSDAQLLAWQAYAHEPLLGIADPARVCASGVLGHLHPAGDPAFAQADTDLATLFERIVHEPLDERFWHGRFNHGQLICGHSPAIYWGYLAHRLEGDELGARAECGPFNNESNDQTLALWCEALRRGDARLLRLARRVATTVADMGHVHVDSDRPERVGFMHYHSGHPWTGPLIPCHTLTTGLLAAACSSGDAWLQECILRSGERILRELEPAGIVSKRTTGLLRGMTGPISVLLDCWQLGFHQAYHDAAARSLHWLLQTVTDGHLLPNSVQTSGARGDEALVQPPNWPEVAWGNRYQVWLLARRHCDSPALRAFLQAEGDYWAQRFPLDQHNYNAATLCLAYDLNGDPALAAYADHVIAGPFHDEVDRFDRREEINFGRVWHGGFIPRLMAIVAAARERDPVGFKQACAAWRRQRQQQPDRPAMDRPDAAPVRRLGRLTIGPIDA